MSVKEIVNKRFAKAVDAIIRDGKVKNKKEISDSLEIGSSKFSEILNKRMFVGIDVIQKFCSIYDVNYYHIFNGEEPFYMNREQKKTDYNEYENATKENILNEGSVSYNNNCKSCKEKERIIQAQQQTIASLKTQVDDLRIDKLQLIEKYLNKED